MGAGFVTSSNRRSPGAGVDVRDGADVMGDHTEVTHEIAGAPGQFQVPDRPGLLDLGRLNACRAVRGEYLVAGLQVAGPRPSRSRLLERMAGGRDDRLAAHDQAQRARGEGLIHRGDRSRAVGPIRTAAGQDAIACAERLDRATAAGGQNESPGGKARVVLRPLTLFVVPEQTPAGAALAASLADVAGPLCGT